MIDDTKDIRAANKAMFHQSVRNSRSLYGCSLFKIVITTINQQHPHIDGRELISNWDAKLEESSNYWGEYQRGLKEHINAKLC